MLSTNGQLEDFCSPESTHHFQELKTKWVGGRPATLRNCKSSMLLLFDSSSWNLVNDQNTPTQNRRKLVMYDFIWSTLSDSGHKNWKWAKVNWVTHLYWVEFGSDFVGSNLAWVYIDFDMSCILVLSVPTHFVLLISNLNICL